MPEILTPEQIAEIKLLFRNMGFASVEKLIDSHDALQTKCDELAYRIRRSYERAVAQNAVFRNMGFASVEKLIDSHDALQTKCDELAYRLRAWQDSDAEKIKIAEAEATRKALRAERSLRMAYEMVRTRLKITRSVLAWAYQAAGVLKAPAWVMDILIDAASGKPLRHELNPLNPDDLAGGEPRTGLSQATGFNDGTTAMTLRQITDAATHKAFEEAAEYAGQYLDTDSGLHLTDREITEWLRRRAGEVGNG